MNENKGSKYAGRWVRMIYLDRGGRFSRRTIYVRRTDGAYIIGYCRERRQMRKFLAENVLSILPLAVRAG